MTLPKGAGLVALVSVAGMVVFAICLGGIMAMRKTAEFQIERNEKERVVNYYIPGSPPPRTGVDR